MSEPLRSVPCPECHELVEAVDRRDFLRAVGGTLALGAVAPNLLAADKKAAPAPRTEKPAEALVKELFAGLSTEQKQQVVLPWNHGAENGKKLPTRLGMYNAPIGGKKIGAHYTKPQQELIARILRAISSDEDGYRRITRDGTFDNSGSLENCGATLFGDPSGKWAWVFTGHHLTVRCDGDSEEGAAFGGPIYYGHSPNGYSPKNIFHYQTKAVLSVYEALSEAQRQRVIVRGTPGEHEPSVRFRKKGEARPGLPYAELTPDQRTLVEQVMREVLSPYRKEDVDEVMKIIKETGGMEKIHLAFYQDKEGAKDQWHFWRLEGPGFVWNYRVLPHVHTYVNISSKV